jgi:hypothetical protein
MPNDAVAAKHVEIVGRGQGDIVDVLAPIA